MNFLWSLLWKRHLTSLESRSCCLQMCSMLEFGFCSLWNLCPNHSLRLWCSMLLSLSQHLAHLWGWSDLYTWFLLKICLHLHIAHPSGCTLLDSTTELFRSRLIHSLGLQEAVPYICRGWQCDCFPPLPDLILSRPLWQKKACRIFITLLLFRKNCLVSIAHNQEEKQPENSQSLLQMNLLWLVLPLLHKSRGRWKKSPLCRQSLCKCWVCCWSMLVWVVTLLCSETKGCTASYLELASGLLIKPSYI